MLETSKRTPTLRLSPGASARGHLRRRQLPWYCRSNPASELDTVSTGNHATSAAGSPAATSSSPLRRYAHDSAEEPGRLSWLVFGNDAEGVEIRATFEAPAEVAWFPVETVSNSEAGFERQYQGSCLLLRWPLALAPGESRKVGVRFDVSSTRDNLAEETAPRP